MVCYTCPRRAVGDCSRCGRHYCNAHGRGLCEECASPTSALPADLTYRAAVVGSALLAVIGIVFLQVWPAPPAGRPPVLLFSCASTPSDLLLDADLVPTPVLPFTTLRPDNATPTPAVTPATPSPTPTPRPQEQYTVVSGDTLLGIAARAGTTVDALVGANGLSSANALLRIGQVLTIPR